MKPLIRATCAVVATHLALQTAPTLAAETPATSMERSSPTNVDLVLAAFERWRDGGGFFDQLVVDDVRWTIHGSGRLAKTYTSRQAFIREAVAPFAARLQRPVMPGIRYIVGQDNVVIVVWDGESIARDNVPYRNSYVWIFTLRDGKAVEVEAFLDLVPYYAVLDRVPVTASDRR